MTAYFTHRKPKSREVACPRQYQARCSVKCLLPQKAAPPRPPLTRGSPKPRLHGQQGKCRCHGVLSQRHRGPDNQAEEIGQR